jgi:CreA protein
MRCIALCLATAFFGISAGSAFAQQVGEVGVDWLGNDIIVEAIKDPKVDGVTCHVSYFDRGVVDRLQKGNWFEDPSDTAISCQQTGPITIRDIEFGQGGEEVFKQGISLIWKQQVVNRIYDKDQRDADLSLPFAAGAGRLGQDGDLHRAALRPGGRHGPSGKPQ